MFGYVRPHVDSFSEDEKARFSAVYCGLCNEIGRTYGTLARMLLNFDFTFLALLLDRADAGETAEAEPFRCPAHPVKKRCRQKSTAGLRTAAAAGMILTYHKLGDSMRDERGLKRLAAWFLRGVYKKAYRKAAAKMPSYAESCELYLAELSEMERQKESSLDKMADRFASLLAAVVPEEAAADSRILRQILYHTGRWIYIVDACDDLSEDGKTGAYNPVAARFGLTDSVIDEEVRDTLMFTLEHSLAQIAVAENLLPDREDSAVLRNILYLGMPSVTAEVMRRAAPQNNKETVT